MAWTMSSFQKWNSNQCKYKRSPSEDRRWSWQIVVANAAYRSRAKGESATTGLWTTTATGLSASDGRVARGSRPSDRRPEGELKQYGRSDSPTTHCTAAGACIVPRRITIKEHKDDQGLDGKGSTFTWPLECNKAYCMFRLLQTGKNSNGHHYLACSGFEMYGHLRAAQAKIPKKQLRTFKYSYDFDSNGLFYWLGTR